MTEGQSSVATVSSSEAKPVESVQPSASTKEKKPRSPAQLEVLRRGRETRSKNAKERKRARASGSLARSDGGAEFIDRIARADPETSERGRSPKRQKRSRGFQLGTPKEFAIGALVLGGLAVTAYQAKKKTSPSSSAPPPTAKGTTQTQQPNPTLFSQSNVFAP